MCRTKKKEKTVLTRECSLWKKNKRKWKTQQYFLHFLFFHVSLYSSELHHYGSVHLKQEVKSGGAGCKAQRLWLIYRVAGCVLLYQLPRVRERTFFQPTTTPSALPPPPPRGGVICPLAAYGAVRHMALNQQCYLAMCKLLRISNKLTSNRVDFFLIYILDEEARSYWLSARISIQRSLQARSCQMCEETQEYRHIHCSVNKLSLCYYSFTSYQHSYSEYISPMLTLLFFVCE